MVRCAMLLVLLSALGCSKKAPTETSSSPATAPAATTPATPAAPVNIEGRWQVVSMATNGEDTNVLKANIVLEFRDGRQIVHRGDRVSGEFEYAIDSSTSPMSFDLTLRKPDGEVSTDLSIVELKGDDLRICGSQHPKPRPTEFVSTADNTLMTLKRLPAE